MTMDRVIQKKQRPWWQWLAGIVGVGLTAWWIYQLVADVSVRSVRVPASQLIISNVQLGTLEDVISVRGSVQPLTSDCDPNAIPAAEILC